MRNVIDTLEERGFLEALTHEEIRKLVEKPLKVYCGFDPTSDSLHLGNLIAIMGLAWFERCGHTPVAIVGGATGMIGDPSGKKRERNLLDEETIGQNLMGIRKNLEAVLEKPTILNNYDWFKEFSYIEFLRDVGKNFRMGPMLAKDSVKTRLASEEGISYTEFSYQILQGYDFYHLNEMHDVTVQLGGSDQWGNITAGIELTRKMSGKQVYGVTFPLLVKSDGEKFGKSAIGAVWLSPERVSPYEFYQHLYRTTDADVIKLMRMLTFMEMDEIREYEAALQQPDHVPNSAQKRLAEEVTRIVHGEEALKVAREVTAGAKPGAKTVLDATTLETIAANMPSYETAPEDVLGGKLIDLIVKAQPQRTKGDARRLIRNGGVYLNNERVEDENLVIDAKHLIDGRLLLLAVGKKNKVLVRLVKG